MWTTCSFLDGLATTSSNHHNPGCQIKRSNRQCLVCPGRMDLIQVRQTIRLMCTIPLCSVETMDLLDCPDCGFSTSVEAYDYLRNCQSQQGIIKTNCSSDCGLALLVDNDPASNICRSCSSKVAAKWQYCPSCGEKKEQQQGRSSPPRVVRFDDETVRTHTRLMVEAPLSSSVIE
jgi:hypothetical protein